MKKRILWAGLILIMFFPVIVCAEAWPITSGFGWREHPVFGGYRFHDGVDFGLDSGVAVPAADGGNVVYSGWYGGYGNYVEIDHGDGSTSFYGHLSSTTVYSGQTVSKGQLLGYVGSTGYSTGPHLHLGYWRNGAPADPVPFLQANGWAISNIPDPNAPAVALHDLDGYPDPGTVSWDLSSFYEFGKSLEDYAKIYAEASNYAIEVLRSEANTLLSLLLVIEIAWIATQKGISGEPVALHSWLMLLFQSGIVLYLINNWPDFVNTMISPLFTTGAVEFFGGSASVADNFSKPGNIVQKGLYIITPAFNYIAQSVFTLNIMGVITCQILALLILLTFVLMGVALVLYHIEFYILSAVALLSLPFSLSSGIFSGIKSFPGGVVGSLIGSAIKILIASIFVTILVNLLSPMEPVAYELTTYLKMFASCGLFLYLVARVPVHMADTLKGKINI